MAQLLDTTISGNLSVTGNITGNGISLTGIVQTDNTIFTRNTSTELVISARVESTSPSLTPNTASVLSMDANGNLRVIDSNPLVGGTIGDPSADVLSVQAPGWFSYHKVGSNSSNPSSVTTYTGILASINGSNNGNNWVYLKIYDINTAPNVGNTSPVAVFGIPPGDSISPKLSGGIKVSNGISIAITAGIADSDNTSITANTTVVGLLHS